nr:replication initiation factor domain-containing protein [uncultured Tolumonas sp.]
MSAQHTKIDYFTAVFSLPLLSDVAKNCADLQYLASNPSYEIAVFLHDAHVVAYKRHIKKTRRDFSDIAKRAAAAQQIFTEIIGHDRPLQWQSAPSAALEQCSRGKLQKEFTQKTLEMLMPFFGGEAELNELFLDCIIVSLSKIYGKNWEINRRAGKKFFYENWGELTLDGMPAGLVAWDFKNMGAMFSLSGAGCNSTDFRRVHRLLTHDDMSIFKPKISRVDIAMDDLTGEKISYQKMRTHAISGLFTPARGASPRYSAIESGHVVIGRYNREKGILEPHTKLDFFPDRGCSLYVGSRESGKMCRGYEKGIQMKSEEFPRWFRVEYELRAVDRVLPPEILLNHDRFFCGCSAAAARIFSDVTDAQAEPVHILTFRAQVHAGVEHVKKFAALQAARVVVWMREVEEMGDTQIVDFLIARLDGRCEKDRIPKRLAVPVPYSSLPRRGPDPENRPSSKTTNPVLVETKTLNDFFAALTA